MKAILKEQTTTIIDRLSYHAQTYPHRAAYEFLRDGGQCESITYQQLEERVRSLAASLQTRAAAGDRAVLMYASGLEFVSAFLACLHAGIIAVPTPAVSRSRKTQRLKTILDDARPRLILTTAELASSLDSALTQDMDDCAVISTDQIESSESHPAWPALSADTIAYLQYTSGSTSAPKGVIITHGNIIANCKAVIAGFGFPPESVMVNWLPLFHDMGLLGNILVPLYGGYLSVMMSPSAFIQSPVRWLQAITKYRGTCAGGPNFSWDYCARMVSDEDKQGLDLSSLKTAFNGAEPIRAETIKRFCEAFAAQGFRPEAVFPCYGMAEATLFVSGGPSGRIPPIKYLSGAALEKNRIVEVSANYDDAKQMAPCGRVWEDTKVLIVNPETRVVCAPDEVGEIWVSGGSVGKGYWNRPELSKEIFQAHLSSGEGPFLRTGDLGYMQNGELFVTGRRKDMIIVRGRNIYPQDIEATVERVTTFVKANSCAAFSVDIDGQEKVVLVVEADRGLARKLNSVRDESGSNSAAPEVTEIIGRMTQAVTEEHEIPLHTVAFVQPGAFPRTSSGKVQRSLCRSRLLDGSLDVVYAFQGKGLSDLSNKPQLDMNGLIKTVIRDWALKEKGLSDMEIDDNVSFMTLGIDSLGAVAIALDLERRTRKKLDPEALYDYRTVNELADYLRSQHLHPGREATATTHSPDGASSSRRRLPERILQFNQRVERWKQEEKYFFHTEISEQTGAWIVSGGKRMLMLGSYSYLGLVDHPAIAEAACQAILNYGSGPHGTRILTGTTSLHRELEGRLAEFMGAEDALVYSSGFMCNLATISSLVGEGDCVIGDEWNHASIVDGCKFSGAAFLQFNHNDMESLERRLIEAAGRHTLVVVDSVFSMDGDLINLPAVVKLCRRYGALLMVDEAHSLGVMGKTGRGIIEHFGMEPDSIDIKMGTLSKAIPSIGGFVAANREIVSFLKHQARGFIFSGAVPAPQVAASLAALKVIKQEPERIARLWEITRQYTAGLKSIGFDTYRTQTPIAPVACRTEEMALEMTRICRDEGLFVIPVFYPAVPMNSPRLRTCVSAAHTAQDIEFALEVLAYAGRKTGLVSRPG